MRCMGTLWYPAATWWIKLLLEQLGDDTRYFGLFRRGSPLGYSGGAILGGALYPAAWHHFPVSGVHAVCGALRGHVAADEREQRHALAQKARVPVKQLFTNWQSAHIRHHGAWGFS